MKAWYGHTSRITDLITGVFPDKKTSNKEPCWSICRKRTLAFDDTPIGRWNETRHLLPRISLFNSSKTHHTSKSRLDQAMDCYFFMWWLVTLSVEHQEQTAMKYEQIVYCLSENVVCTVEDIFHD